MSHTQTKNIRAHTEKIKDIHKHETQIIIIMYKTICAHHDVVSVFF